MLHPLPLSELCAPAVALIRAKARGPKVQGCPEAGGGPAHESQRTRARRGRLPLLRRQQRARGGAALSGRGRSRRCRCCRRLLRRERRAPARQAGCVEHARRCADCTCVSRSV
jgi:hypothetical protein